MVAALNLAVRSFLRENISQQTVAVEHLRAPRDSVNGRQPKGSAVAAAGLRTRMRE